jgi:DNA-binding NarL/FixJ family response regulator
VLLAKGPAVSRTRVLLVEDEAETLDRIGRALAAEPRLDVIGLAGSCAEARRLLAADAPDVLLVDLGLPDGNGTELIRELRGRHPRTECMVITVFGDERSVVAAIEAGAGGYLLKDATDEEIPRAVLDLAGGGSPISPAIARHLLRRLQSGAGGASAAGADAPHLSAREREVLELLARGFRIGEIAGALGITGHTVTTHVRHLYRKLEVGSRGEAIYEAMSRGLLRPGP